LEEEEELITNDVLQNLPFGESFGRAVSLAAQIPHRYTTSNDVAHSDGNSDWNSRNGLIHDYINKNKDNASQSKAYDRPDRLRSNPAVSEADEGVAAEASSSGDNGGDGLRRRRHRYGQGLVCLLDGCGSNLHHTNEV
jgi:hypothetical protein